MIDRFALIDIRIFAIQEAILFIGTLPYGISSIGHAIGNRLSVILQSAIVGIHATMAVILWVTAVPIARHIAAEANKEPAVYTDGGYETVCRGLLVATGFLILCQAASPLGKILPELSAEHTGSLARNVFGTVSFVCVEMIVYLGLRLLLIFTPKGLWN